MKKLPLNFIIPLVVYPFDVMVSIGEDDKSLFKKLKKYGVDITMDELSHSATARGRTIMFAGNQTLIRLYNRTVTPNWHGNLSHEVFHAVQFIFERIGSKLTYESSEGYAYLIDYITKEIYKRV